MDKRPSHRAVWVFLLGTATFTVGPELYGRPNRPRTDITRITLIQATADPELKSPEALCRRHEPALPARTHVIACTAAWPQLRPAGVNTPHVFTTCTRAHLRGSARPETLHGPAKRAWETLADAISPRFVSHASAAGTSLTRPSRSGYGFAATGCRRAVRRARVVRRRDERSAGHSERVSRGGLESCGRGDRRRARACVRVYGFADRVSQSRKAQTASYLPPPTSERPWNLVAGVRPERRLADFSEPLFSSFSRQTVLKKEETDTRSGLSVIQICKKNRGGIFFFSIFSETRRGVFPPHRLLTRPVSVYLYIARPSLPAHAAQNPRSLFSSPSPK